MKTSFLLFLVLLLTTSFADKEKPACHCIDYYKNKPTYKTPSLEFQAGVSGIDFHKVTNGLAMDSLFVQSQLTTSDYENLQDFFIINISHENHFLENPRIGFANAKDTSLINKLFKHYQEQNLEYEDRFRLLWSHKSTANFTDGGEYFTLYAIRKPVVDGVVLTNENVEGARVSRIPLETEMGVSITFDDVGSEKMSVLSTQHHGQNLLIISHNQVLSDPIILEPIKHGYVFIQGGFTLEEAVNLSDLINCAAYSHRIGQDEFEKEMKRCK